MRPKFLDVAKKYNMTFNDDKSIISTTSIKLLVHMISKDTIKPDPDSLLPLQELPAPHDLASFTKKNCWYVRTL